MPAGNRAWWNAGTARKLRQAWIHYSLGNVPTSLQEAEALANPDSESPAGLDWRCGWQISD